MIEDAHCQDPAGFAAVERIRTMGDHTSAGVFFNESLCDEAANDGDDDRRSPGRSALDHDMKVRIYSGYRDLGGLLTARPTLSLAAIDASSSLGQPCSAPARDGIWPVENRTAIPLWRER